MLGRSRFASDKSAELFISLGVVGYGVSFGWREGAENVADYPTELFRITDGTKVLLGD